MQRRKYTLGVDMRVRWTADEDARLARLLAQGKSLSEIAKLINRTEGAVERRKERLGLKRIPVKLSRHNPVDIAQLVKFKLAGWTHEAIAEVFDVIPAYISNLLIANGYKYFCAVNRPKTCPGWTEIESHWLRKCLKRGDSLQQIYSGFPHHSQLAIHAKIRQITRYWITPAKRAEQERMRKKQLRVY